MLAQHADHVSLLGAALYETVRSAKVLVVGAGGIGCELLKNLVLTGFCGIEVRLVVARAFLRPPCVR